MWQNWTPLALLPSNGLDRSLHAPVLIGLLLLALFRETLGWGYAGLVVPGYLAAVLVAAPVTGALVVGESLLAYALAHLLGRLIPQRGAWFSFFGRERFLLLILVSTLVRVVVEAALVPQLAAALHVKHSRELYSLGLVLVPLISNSYWNVGLARGVVRLSILTGLTYLAIVHVLLPHTNFTLSRFAVANESVSLAFLEAPHAQFILLSGAVLAAFANVRYGWDYNGILIPALLAVAWYEPLKLATTLAESLVLLATASTLIRVRPFSEWPILGPRRLLLIFVLGFMLKLGLGFLAMRLWPGVELIDYFGFGYLLPSLLAVKMWDQQQRLRVLLPAGVVSMIAFPLGNLIGYALASAEAGAAVPTDGVVEAPLGNSAAAQLMVDASVPADAERDERTLRTRYERVLDFVVANYAGDDAAVVPKEIARHRSPDGWEIIGPALGPNGLSHNGPSMAYRDPATYTRALAIIVEPTEVGGPDIALAMLIADRLGARLVSVRNQHPRLAQYDDQIVEQLAPALGVQHLLVVRAAEAPAAPTLSVSGALAEPLEMARLASALGSEVRLQFTSAPSAVLGLPRSGLSVSRRQAEAAVLAAWGPVTATRFGPLTLRSLERKLNALTERSAFEAPSIGELRVATAAFLARLLAPERHEPLSPWERRFAAVLGYTTGEFSLREANFTIVYEAEVPARRGLPTLVVGHQRAAGDLLLGVPAPREERGTLPTAAAMIASGLAAGVVVNGTGTAAGNGADPRGQEGRRSYYQRVSELWLHHGGRALVLRGAGDDLSPRNALFSFGRPLAQSNGPSWLDEVSRCLTASGRSTGVFDATPDTAAYGGQGDPVLSYSRRFGLGDAAILWLDRETRRAVSRRTDNRTLSRLLRLGAFGERTASPQGEAQRRLECLRQRDTSCGAPSHECSLEGVLTAVAAYNLTNNPYDLDAALSLSRSCAGEVTLDPLTGVAWLGLTTVQGSVGMSALVPDKAQTRTELRGDKLSPWLLPGQYILNNTPDSPATQAAPAPSRPNQAHTPPQPGRLPESPR